MVRFQLHVSYHNIIHTIIFFHIIRKEYTSPIFPKHGFLSQNPRTVVFFCKSFLKTIFSSSLHIKVFICTDLINKNGAIPSLHIPIMQRKSFILNLYSIIALVKDDANELIGKEYFI